MEDNERVIYYEVVRELPFAKIGDQCVFLTDGDVGINGIIMPIKYVNCDFFKPVTLVEHQEMIHKNFILYIMKEKNIDESDAEMISKDFWKLNG